MATDFFRKYADLITEAENPAVKPATTSVDPKVAMGAQSLAKTVGASDSGQMVAKGLGKVAQGQAVTGQMSQAIAPFIEPLEKILADPMMKQKFLNLIKQVQ